MKEVNHVKLDTTNIILIVAAVILGVLYFSIRNARKQRLKKSNRKPM